ncbi:cellulose biosynthesis protein BcsS [Methylobacterium sp. J-030]|uniref:cellulose biosynthesis protein BcsS n=1 Tax=Methylobacterium sp. J-030 TaxID=2836627 RepID=UPI001FB8F54D|nr:cellulose biosynthesis protein BcsS [Methylobacterium sp. J-030]MCJ2073216.1 cellulose biosynthesis protein BcsS [Methylobacterium sp. J-030]
MLLFGSLDADAATFVTAGVKIGLPSLEDDGFVALASLGGGRQGERDLDGPRRRYTAVSAVGLGYQWFFDWGVVAAFAGPEGSVQMLTDGLGPTMLPLRFGLRLHGEVWARPTEATMVQTTVIAGSAIDSVWMRTAWGYRLWGAYLGPEASLYTAASGYREWKFGLHGTDFAVGCVSFRVSVGIQSEAHRRAVAPYVTLAVWSAL